MLTSILIAMLWLTNLPSWITFLLVVAAANAVGLWAMLLARRWYRPRGVTTGPAVINAWATCLGALAAVLCAFTVITLWSIFISAKASTASEAAAIRLAARDLLPAQLPLLRRYVDGSVQEWRQMCGGRPDVRVGASLVALERRAAPREPQYADDLYRQLAILEDARYERWQRATESAPAELKIALCIVGLALLAVLAIAMPDRLDTHVALTILISTSLGAAFWVMLVLSYPYCGSFSIGPDQIISAMRAHG